MPDAPAPDAGSGEAANSEAASSDAGGLTDPADLGRGIGERFRSPAARRPGTRRAGDLARAVRSFGRLAGRSVVARRQLGGAVAGVGVEHLPVGLDRRWWPAAPGADPDEPSGSPNLDHLRQVLRTRQGRRADHTPPPAGLPRATGRAGHSAAGRGTGPGGAARRLAPTPVPSAVDPAVRVAFGEGGATPASAPSVGGGRTRPAVPSPSRRRGRPPGQPPGPPAPGGRRPVPGSPTAAVVQRRLASGLPPAAPMPMPAVPAGTAALAAAVAGPTTTPAPAVAPTTVPSPAPAPAGPGHPPTVGNGTRAAGPTPARPGTAAPRPTPASGTPPAAGGPATPDAPAAPATTPAARPGSPTARPAPTPTSGGPATPDAPAGATPAPSGGPSPRSAPPADPVPPAGLGRLTVPGRPGLLAQPSWRRPPGGLGRATLGPAAPQPDVAGQALGLVAPPHPGAAPRPATGPAAPATPATPAVAGAPARRRAPGLPAAGPSSPPLPTSATTPRAPATTPTARPSGLPRPVGAAPSTPAPAAARADGDTASPGQTSAPPHHRPDRPHPGSLGSRLTRSDAAGAATPGVTAPPALPGAGAGTPATPSRYSATTGRRGTARADRPHLLDRSERFDAVLRHRRPDTPTLLPRQLRPLAVAVAGTDRIPISSGPASRAALAAAGRTAATADGVIHLPAPPTLRDAPVVAHELVHAAAGAGPAPGPRFLDDDRPGQEEQTARTVQRAVGGLARHRAQPAGTPGMRPGTDGLPVGGLAGLSRPATSAGGGDGAAGRSNRTAGGGGGWTSAGPRRARPAGPARPSTPPPPPPAPPAAPAATEAGGGTGFAGLGATGAGMGQAGGLVHQAAQRVLGNGTGGTEGAGASTGGDTDELVRLVLDRVLSELDRRGRRIPGVLR